MWAGRTDGNTNKIADDFNSSIKIDCKMYRQDITGSMAHAVMLGAKGIIEKAEADKLIDGLQTILDDIENGVLAIDMTAEDIHMFVEQELTKRIVFSTDKDLRYYLMEYIEKQGTLAPKALNQWHFIPEEWVKPATARDYDLLFKQ